MDAYYHRFRIIFIIILLCFSSLPSALLYSQESNFIFNYRFDKKVLNIAETLKITINLEYSNYKKEDKIDIRKEAFENSVFYIENIDYSSSIDYDFNNQRKSTYEITFEAGVNIDKLLELGIHELPIINIEYKTASNIERTFQVGPEMIEVVNRNKLIGILIIIIISIIILFIIIILVIYIIGLKHKKKSIVVANEDYEQLINTSFRKYKDKKAVYEKDKHTKSYLENTKNILLSFVLRKYKVTNIDDFYKLENITAGSKVSVRSLLTDIDDLIANNDSAFNTPEITELHERIKKFFDKQ